MKRTLTHWCAGLAVTLGGGSLALAEDLAPPVVAEIAEAPVAPPLAAPPAAPGQPLQVQLVEEGAQPIYGLVAGAAGEAAPPDPLAEKIAASKYWIGVSCQPIDDVLKAQLGIEHGLSVEHVVDDSPAAAAKLAKYDVLLAIGDHEVDTVEQLIDAVEATEGKEATIQFIRGGKREKIYLTPADRPQAKEKQYRQAVIQQLEAGELKTLKIQLEKLRDQDKAFDMMIVRPGVVVPPDRIKLRAFPSDVTVNIKKDGKQPAEITVTRGEKKWTVTEDKLGDLPDDVRELVLHVRGGQEFSLRLDAPAGDQRKLYVYGTRKEGDPIAPARIAVRALPPGLAPHAVPALPGVPGRAPADVLMPHAAARAIAVPLDAGHQQLAELNAKMDEVLRAVRGDGDVKRLSGEVDQLRREVDELKKQLNKRD